MRLINTSTLEFREFFDAQRPRYAILSHTWEDEEVSYLDYLFLTSNPHEDVMGAIQALLKNPRRHSAGFEKIRSWCHLALRRGYEWVWIDTCCIDKSSSAELSEAINSMYKWYADAVECFVYLSDVSASPNSAALSLEDVSRNEANFYEQLKRARWFTRGWTLQELLAPHRVVFCNNKWEVLASKSSIAPQLSQITSIPLPFLDGSYLPNDGKLCSVAMRMSWVSQRETTRSEDMAYCMLGLFDVNMPLIYGEGRKAFMRLQLEVIKKTDDDSIYAWTEQVQSSGLLATWPTAFKDSGRICQVLFDHDEVAWIPPVMTPIGLEFRAMYHRDDRQQDQLDRKHGVHTIQTARPVYDETSIILHCTPLVESSSPPITQHWSPHMQGKAIVIFLHRFGATWQRIHCSQTTTSFYGNPGSSGSEAYLVYYVRQQGL